MAQVRQLDAVECRHYLDSLADVLVDCVAGGASVGFMASLTLADAKAFFERCVEEVACSRRLLLAAFVETKLVGTVQIVTAMPPNQPHRCDITKLLVHRAGRRQGIGRLLMEHVDLASRGVGKSLLVLDTVTGGAAEELYRKLGWTKVGIIPQYALFPDGASCDTTIFYKQLM